MGRWRRSVDVGYGSADVTDETPTPETISRAEWLRARAASPYFALARAGLLDCAAAIERLERERDEAWEKLAEHESSFKLRWAADMRAIKRWQAEAPGRELTWPDHADLCVWLLAERDALRAALRELDEATNASFPAYESTAQAQAAWGDRIYNARQRARALLDKEAK